MRGEFCPLLTPATEEAFMTRLVDAGRPQAGALGT